jgi:uncharacterized protein YlxW (UPF0749 family)
VTALRTWARSIPSWQLTLFAALAVLGFLVAAQLGSEQPRIRYTSQERAPLVETATGLQAQQDQLKVRIVELRAQIQAIETRGQGSAAQVRDLNAQLEAARAAAGLIALAGPGAILRLEDSDQAVPPGANPIDYRVSAHDVQTVVNELWIAGAEAIAVNEERVTSTTAIIDIGGSLLVNGAYLAPPYTVSAIGPTDLVDRLATSASWTDFLVGRVQPFDLRVSFAEPEQVSVPAFVGTVTLRYAEEVTPAPSVAP